MNMPTEYLMRYGLRVNAQLANFIETEALPGTGVELNRFWSGLAAVLAELVPVNERLLAQRTTLQTAIDDWYHEENNDPSNIVAFEAFLRDIGYLAPEGPAFSIATSDVDPEIATIAGPQLVVPVSNARFALNAANARWGSLYDALYGTDAIPTDGSLSLGLEYNEQRGAEVIRKSASFLDLAIPLAAGTHAAVVAYEVSSDGNEVLVRLADGSETGLSNPSQFAGYVHDGSQRKILFRNNGLHIECQFDPGHPIGAQSAADLSDIILEAAVTTIQDCEDSVAAVDADDKVRVYANWLGLMKGDLQEIFDKDGKNITRCLESDREYVGADGKTLKLQGRSLMLVRNVGLLMTTDAVLDGTGSETPEGILDAMITSICAMHDLKKTSGIRNSRSKSVYIVKPKLHGPEEAAFTNTLFGRVEDVLGLPRNTLKIGVMDEERRTSVNLKECIRAVRERIVFINTGFLDRTGDEIHTVMHADVVLPKTDMKSATWLYAYENNNVDVALEAGFAGRAQIGKGMWAKPDAMAEMLESKGSHPDAGASTAWVPSPTAAVLHAMHYHKINVHSRQQEIASRQAGALGDLLSPPLLGERVLFAAEIAREIDNSCQSILGYVVRWIDQGVGCSKVPDIDDIGLMEDRATLRISSQVLANWLMHGICSRQQVEASFKRMAAAVDEQNASDQAYRNMAPDFGSSIAFKTALELVFDGADQPSGYTEPILHRCRREAKSKREKVTC